MGLIRLAKSLPRSAVRFARCEIEKRGVAARFELARQRSAEIGFDLRPAERAQVIGARAGAIGAAEQPAVLLEFLGMIERQEELVVEPERQGARGVDFVGDRRREKFSSASAGVGTAMMA